MDSAFLRRMPVQIQMKMPNENSRLCILRAQLKNEIIADDLDLEIIASKTDGFSGKNLLIILAVAATNLFVCLYSYICNKY